MIGTIVNELLVENAIFILFYCDSGPYLMNEFKFYLGIDFKFTKGKRNVKIT